MGRGIVKLGPNQYVDWSTVIDAPVSYVLTADEMIERRIRQAKKEAEESTREALERADRTGTSYLGITGVKVIDDNRAGEDESKLTREQLIEKFTYREESENEATDNGT